MKKFKKNRKCPKCSTKGARSRFIKQGCITLHKICHEIEDDAILRCCVECDYSWLELSYDNNND